MTPTFAWGTITSISPLRLQLDGDTAPLPFTPDTLIDPLVLSVDDRVRCELTERRLVVHGRSGGLAVQLPIGVVQWFAGASAPSAAWLICDGGPVSRSTYGDLFALIGTTYGAGNGSTTFNLPDLRERAAFGAKAATALGTATFTNATDLVNRAAHGLVAGDRVYFTGGTMPTGLAASTRYFVRDSTANTFRLETTLGGGAINFTTDGSGTRTLFVENFALGYAGGERAHKLTGPETPNLPINIRRFDGDASDYLAGSNSPYGIATPYSTGGADYNIAYTGGGEQSHNNLPPYLALTPMIKALDAP